MAASLVSPDDSPLLWAVIAAGSAAAILLEQKYRWAARLTAPVVALLIAMVLSNTRLLPPEAPAYGVIEKWLVPLAVPMLLARASLREILKSGRGPLIAVHLAAIGSLLGTFLAVFLLRPFIASPAMEQAAALMAASYIGGSVNFFAIKSSYSVPESVTGPLLVADNFVMAGFFLAALAIAGSRWFLARYPHPHISQAAAVPASGTATTGGESGLPAGSGTVTVRDLALAFTFAFTVLALAALAERGLRLLTAPFSTGGAAAQMLVSLLTNRFVLLTAISLVLATLLSRQLARIRGFDAMGTYMLLLFLFVIGLPADLWLVFREAPLFFVFCLIIALGNVAFTLAAGRLLRLNLEELLLAMNATLGGPPTAAAMAAGTGWPRLVLPGLLIGLWGYVIGTPAGILVMELLRRQP